MKHDQAVALARWCAANHMGTAQAARLDPAPWVIDAIRTAAAGAPVDTSDTADAACAAAPKAIAAAYGSAC